MAIGNQSMTYDQEIQMFGMTKEQIKKEYIQSWMSYHTGIEMQVISILSDAQHLMEFGQDDRARKLMNVAKYILSEQLDSQISKMQKKVA
jgi:hypothetical protein